MKLNELVDIYTQLKSVVENIEEKLMEHEWQKLLMKNLKILAIKAYRKKYNSTLSEAKKAIEDFEELLKKVE